jgi:hypothetical protein
VDCHDNRMISSNDSGPAVAFGGEMSRSLPVD